MAIKNVVSIDEEDLKELIAAALRRRYPGTAIGDVTAADITFVDDNNDEHTDIHATVDVTMPGTPDAADPPAAASGG